MTRRPNRKQSPMCAAVQRVLGDAEALEALTEAQLQEISAHLQTCDDCTQVLVEYDRVDTVLRELAADPPADLVKLLMAEVPEALERANEAEALRLDDPLDRELIAAGYLTAPPPLIRASYLDVQPGAGEDEKLDDLDELLASEFDMASGQEPEGGDPAFLANYTGDDSGAEHARPRWLVSAFAGFAVAMHESVPPRLPDDWFADLGHQARVADDVLRKGVMSRPTVCYSESRECREQMERVVGPEASMRAAVEILEDASRREVPVDGYITMTWFLDASILEYAHTLWQDWMRAVRRALDHGWGVKHLIQSTPDMRKAPRIAEYLRHFLDLNGLYEPFLLPLASPWSPPMERDDPASARCEFITVPGLGGLRFVALDGECITQCEPIPDNGQLEVTEARLAKGIRHARRVYEKTFPSPSNEYLREILKIERFQADRFAIINGIGESMIPFAIHRQRAAEVIRSGFNRTDAAYTLRLLKERQQALEENLVTFEHVDVCPTGAIARLVNHGVYQALDTWAARGAGKLDTAQVRRVLESLIERIKTQPNYHFLLLEHEGAEMNVAEFVAKADCGAMVEFWLRDAEGERTRVDLEITEPSIVAALHGRAYRDLIKAHCMSESDVVTFLSEQLAAL